MRTRAPELPTRICTKCSKELPIHRFEVKKIINKSTGKTYWCRRGACRDCMSNIYTKPYIKEHRAENLAQQKEWQKKQRYNRTDWYLKILAHSTTGVAFRDITPEMVELQRKILTIKDERNKQNKGE